MNKHIRVLYDGKILVLPNNNMKKQIDEIKTLGNYHRKNATDRVWYDAGLCSQLEEHKDIHKGATALVIGKGPSLDLLSSKMIPEDVIIFACNEVIHRIANMSLPNTIYACQMDIGLRGVAKIDGYPAIISVSLHRFYDGYAKAIILNGVKYEKARTGPVGSLAIVAAKVMGCDKFLLTGFDGAFDGSCEYAKVIGYPSRRGGKPERFKGHKAKLLTALHPYKFEHVIPTTTSQIEAFSDILQRWQYSRPMQYEHQDSEHQAESINNQEISEEKDISQNADLLDHSDS